MSDHEDVKAVITEKLSKVFDEYDMADEGDGDMLKFQASIIEAATSVCQELLNARRKITIVPRAVPASTSKPKGSRKGQKGNYSAKFFGLVCRVAKDPETNKFETTEPLQFSDDEHRVTEKNKRFLEELQKHEDIVSSKPANLAELYTLLHERLPQYGNMQLSAIIWSFFMPESEREAYKQNPV